MGKISTKFLLGGLVSMLLGTANPAQAELKFNAVVSYPSNNSGVYSFSTEKYDPKLIAREVYASGGGVAYDDGYFYGVRVETIMGITGVQQNSWKISNWEASDSYSATIDKSATAWTFDRDLGLSFGCFYNADGATFRFCQVNVPYWGQTTLFNLDKPLCALGFNKEGVLYAIDEDGLLSIVDVLGEKLAPVGETGLKNEWVTGSLVDKENNVMLYSIKTDTAAALYSVDLATAKATKLYDLENLEQLGGFFFDEPTYNPLAPGKASYTPSLSVSGSNLNGSFAFYAPNYSVDGSVGSGDLKYTIYLNGKVYKTGETQYKKGRISETFEVEKAGYYCFAVEFSNENGAGPRQRADVKWIGPDFPRDLTAPTVSSYADGKATVRWSSVLTTGKHGGSVDRTSYSYKVTRYPDAKVVSADDLKSTSLVDELPLPSTRTSYWYTVEAVSGEMKTNPVATAKFDLGPITPPFEATFTKASDFFGYSTLNPGTDSKKWEYDSSKFIKVSTSAKPANNWLILPPLDLKEGMSYEFKMVARSYSNSYEEELEVCAGTEATAEALTLQVIPSTKVKSGDWKEFTGTITASANGLYYLGVHATTPTNGGYLYIQSITISGGTSDLAPDAISDLKATPGANGAHSASFTFTIPTLTQSGSTLSALTKIELLRDGEVVKTVTDGIETGKQLTIVDDTDPSAGKHLYSIVCYNSYGAGVETKLEIRIGFAEPLPTNLVTMAEPTQGHVVAKWEAVTADAEGNKLSENDVKYNVYKYLSGSLYPVQENVSGTSYEFNPFDGFEDSEKFDDQRFVQAIVEAVTEGGVSKKVPSVMMPVGKAYDAPWRESFANGQTHSIFATEAIKGTDKWAVVSQDDFGVTPMDDDGGMLYLEAYGRGASAIATGKIDLTDVVAPAFIFYVYHYSSSSPNENEFEVEARTTDDGSAYRNLYRSTIEKMGDPNTWCKVIVPLTDYEGQTVQLRVTATNNTYGFSHMDNLSVTSAAPYNLTLTEIEAPETVDPNQKFNINVSILNNGTEKAQGYKVNLMAGDEILETKSGAQLEPEASTTVSFERSYDVTGTGKHNYTVVVEYGPDMFAADNSADFSVIVMGNSLPRVTDLKADPDREGIQLNWTAPSSNTVIEAETEDFDDVDKSWATSIDGWKFIDGDGGTIGGIGKKKLPVSGKQSFFVFDNTYDVLKREDGSLPSIFRAHSGNQFLVSMYSTIGGKMVQSDDWAISPELTGDGQLITLWASSAPKDKEEDQQYLESFQVLYSTTGTDVSDFILVKEFNNIDPLWKKYSFYVPDGAKHFAIHAVSYDKYMLYIDDVTFCAKNGQAKKTVTPTGYNVYRDGKKLNTEDIAQTGYLDKTVDFKSIYSYVVTTLYKEGESNVSNLVEFDSRNSSVDEPLTDSVSIRAATGAIVVCGAEGENIEIITLDGKIVKNFVAEYISKVSVTPGCYIVKAGDKVAKVIVK